MLNKKPMFKPALSILALILFIQPFPGFSQQSVSIARGQ
jgi:hypothetical protein